MVLTTVIWFLTAVEATTSVPFHNRVRQRVDYIDTAIVRGNYDANSLAVRMSSEDDWDHPRVIIDEYENEGLDTDEDLARRFYGSVCREIEQDRLEEGGEQFQRLLREGPRFSNEVLSEIITSNEENECVRLISFFRFLENDSLGRYLSEVGEPFEVIFEDFDERPLYYYCAFLYYREIQRQSSQERAFVNGVSAAEAIDTASNLHYEVASLGKELTREAELSETVQYGEYTDGDEILTKAADFGEKSISRDGNLYEYYLTYASILEIKDDYEKALDILRKGREFCAEEPHLERPGMLGSISSGQAIEVFNERIEAAQNGRKRNQLQRSLEHAQETIDDLNEDLNSVEKSLEDATDEYRTQVIQFIGFFAAILTIALTSVQIATQLTFPQSGGLILTLVGGIIIAFGELNVLFDPDTKRDWQYGWTLLIGLALIGGGLWVGTQFSSTAVLL